MTDQKLDIATIVADELAQPKSKWKSKALISVAVAIAGLAAGKLGYEVDHDALVEIIGFLVTLFGLIGAAYGRAKAMHPITKKGAQRYHAHIEAVVRSAEKRVGGGAGAIPAGVRGGSGYVQDPPTLDGRKSTGDVIRDAFGNFAP